MSFTSTYTLSQWLILFYIYCFIGWVWECCYVSVRVHKWTNRGFMHGPLLPIYGSGAIVMLFTTLPFKDKGFFVVFIMATISATILELCTGEAMERLFKVRYWDYTRYKLNFRGHICLVASMAWGIAGVLLTYCVNKPIEALMFKIPTNMAELIAFGITVIAACDFGASFREAMDMRYLLERLSDEAENHIKRISKRMDVVMAVYGTELEKGAAMVKEKGHDVREKGMEYVDDLKASGQERIEKIMSMLEEMPDRQKIWLRRYIDANPDAESKHNSISELLAALKEKRTNLKNK